jgi:DNA invertase Pin-like site-specific DNA recombinase
MQNKSSLGLEAQRHSVPNYIKSCQGRLIAELTEIESGLKSDRPVIREALWHCRVYCAKLVVAKLDRLARSTALIAALMESAPVAEYEARLISARTKAAFAAAKARGTPLPGGPKGRSRISQAVRNAASRARHERSIAGAQEYAPQFCVLRDRRETLAGVAAQLALMGIEPPSHARKWYPKQ